MKVYSIKKQLKNAEGIPKTFIKVVKDEAKAVKSKGLKKRVYDAKVSKHYNTIGKAARIAAPVLLASYGAKLLIGHAIHKKIKDKVEVKDDPLDPLD